MSTVHWVGPAFRVSQRSGCSVVTLDATVPYVVRKVDSDHVHVGDAFVHGFTYGEALERKDLRPVDIVLV